MKLLSVNVSLPKEITHKGKAVTTAIFKEPVQGRVKIRHLNVDGDKQADSENHGGACKAVYAYPFENYGYWEGELGGSDFACGQFGENFTVEGMTEDEVCIGDVYRVGDALLQVTQPRVPCFKLGIRMGGLEYFPKKFLASSRVGFYMSVLEEGEAGAGDSIERVEIGLGSVTVRKVNTLLFFDKRNIEGMKKALRIPALSPGWRESFARRLAKAGIAVNEIDLATTSAGCGAGL